MNLLIVLSYVFFGSEFVLMLVKRSKKNPESKQGDKGSLLILWVTIPVVLAAGFYSANLKILLLPYSIFMYAGILIFVSGFILRWSAIFQLKKAFTVDVAVNEEHLLKTDGLYKIIRHPSYTGLIMILTGLSIAMSNLVSIVVITLPFFITISYRIKVEEKLLTDRFGDVYEKYKSGTKKIIPYLY